MTKTNQRDAAAKDEPKARFSSDIEMLKSSVTELRDDMTKLLQSALGAGKSGAGMIKNRAATAAVDFKDRMGELKDRGADSLELFEQKIGERPLLSAAIALGIGYVLGKLFSTKR
jgi:ElaB/YqjD/DUF883 family membrane-anchored ribosome-binding protein